MGTRETASDTVETRSMSDRDVEDVRRLLDDAMGRGFWELDTRSPGAHLVAVADGRVVGVASACITAAAPEPVDLPGPVCTLRLVAVDPMSRGRGIATRLVRDVCELCIAPGCVSVLAFAWVHAHTGRAPIAGVLERLGFVCERRIERFYTGATSSVCPGCSAIPCACSADVYVCAASSLAT